MNIHSRKKQGCVEKLWEKRVIPSPNPIQTYACRMLTLRANMLFFAQWTRSFELESVQEPKQAWCRIQVARNGQESSNASGIEFRAG
jgi:hypothetical protein